MLGPTKRAISLYVDPGFGWLMRLSERHLSHSRQLVRKLLLAFGILLAFLLVGAYLSLPDVAYLKKENPRITALMLQREREARNAGRKPRRIQTWVQYNAISNRLKTAVLIGEDDAFFQHEGFDMEQVKESFVRNWEEGRLARGGSTITQQLAKNLYLSTSKNPLRKLKELVIARRLEDKLSKRRIYEIYLNVIEWGDGIYGAEAASQNYFGKSAASLNTHEAVLLAAMIPNPRGMNPRRVTRRLQYRVQMILSRMLQYHHISQEEYQDALKSSTSTEK
jgi:monofunctional biosynthetic peptidoglycan transglycosylase